MAHQVWPPLLHQGCIVIYFNFSTYCREISFSVQANDFSLFSFCFPVSFYLYILKSTFIHCTHMCVAHRCAHMAGISSLFTKWLGPFGDTEHVVIVVAIGIIFRPSELLLYLFCGHLYECAHATEGVCRSEDSL